jgi:hypothetical protein
MKTPFGGGASGPEQLYAASAARFFELLQSLTPAATASAPGNWSQLSAPLAAQFEQWLKAAQSGGPWFSAVGLAPGTGAAGSNAGAGFGPLPLGPGAVPRPEAQRLWELLARLGQLQGQLAVHWGEIARGAAERFVTRAATAGATPSLAQSLKLYELWVACAEEAYASVARGEDFSRLQGELANVSAALLVEQRRQAETLVRAFGLPSRNEMDALYGHVKELGRRLGELESSARPATARARTTARPRKSRARRPGRR